MKHVALYRDLGPSADGHSRSLGAFGTFAEAQNAIRQDVARYCDALRDFSLTIEEDGSLILVKTGLDTYLCAWEIV